MKEKGIGEDEEGEEGRGRVIIQKLPYKLGHSFAIFFEVWRSVGAFWRWLLALQKTSVTFVDTRLRACTMTTVAKLWPE